MAALARIVPQDSPSRTLRDTFNTIHDHLFSALAELLYVRDRLRLLHQGDDEVLARLETVSDEVRAASSATEAGRLAAIGSRQARLLGVVK